jgi:hypothetical protein
VRSRRVVELAGDGGGGGVIQYIVKPITCCAFQSSFLVATATFGGDRLDEDFDDEAAASVPPNPGVDLKQ